jgi:hypothetical protein
MRIVGDVGAKIRSLTLLEPWLITPASEKVKTQSFLGSRAYIREKRESPWK